MDHRARRVSRRFALTGLAGAVVGLPLLDAFQGRTAQAAGREGGDFAVFIVNGNGVEQEGFWPRNQGPLTKAGLQADAGQRALAELADHAERLLVLQGVHHPFRPASDAHNGGDAQCLTAAHPVPGPNLLDVCDGESIDNRIATVRNPVGVESLYLRVGRYPDSATGYDYNGHVSYRPGGEPRVSQENPLSAYQQVVGVVAGSPAASNDEALLTRRKSVNDLIRAQMKALLALPDLSTKDRERLDQHFTAIRDLENKIATTLPDAKLTELEAVSHNPLDQAPEAHEKVLGLQLDVLAFAIMSGYTRSAVLKIGDRIDRSVWVIDGQKLPEFHQISHRIFGCGSDGDPIPDAAAKHRLIDRAHARKLKGFLDQLAAVDTPNGKLIDQGYTAWTNQLATGHHTYDNVPWVITGTAKGFLKTGQHLALGPTPSPKVFNTLLAAAGVKKDNGDPVDDFGKDGVHGVLSEIVAG